MNRQVQQVLKHFFQCHLFCMALRRNWLQWNLRIYSVRNLAFSNFFFMVRLQNIRSGAQTNLQPTFFLAIRVGCFHLAVNERLTLSLHYFQTWWHGVTHCRQMVPNGINAFRSFRHLLPKSTAFSSWCGRGQGEGNVPVQFRLKKHHTEKHVICKTIYVGVCSITRILIFASVCCTCVCARI